MAKRAKGYSKSALRKWTKVVSSYGYNLIESNKGEEPTYLPLKRGTLGVPSSGPHHPQRVVSSLSRILRDRAVVVATW